MKSAKLIGLKLTILSILSMSVMGCGGGSDSETSSSTPSNPIPTDVTVERGKVYDATVVDSENNTATQKNNQNIYTFDDIPKYPITVTGGWVDVDNDGRKTVSDIVLTTPMKSYSTNVTPVTTYIADKNSTVRENRLNTLSAKTGVSIDELMKLPSVGNTDAMLIQNSIFKEIKLNSSIDNISIDAIKASFDSLKNIVTRNPNKSSSELAVLIEKEVISNLLAVNKVANVTLDDAVDMTEDEKNKYLLGVNSDDFILSNTLVGFTTNLPTINQIKTPI